MPQESHKLPTTPGLYRRASDYPRNDLGDCVYCGQAEGRQHDDVEHAEEFA